MWLLHLLPVVLSVGHHVLASQPFTQPVAALSLEQVFRPLKLLPVNSRSSNETGNFLRKLNFFSKLKWKNREQAGDLVTSDSTPVLRFSPYTMPPPMAVRPYPMPLASASMRGYSYYPPPYFMNPDPYGMAARRIALAPRHAFMPASSMPAYFPLGSMTGTPIMDPGFQAALASSLVNRYSPPMPLMGGPSYLSSSLFDDGIDQASLAHMLKRYLKNNKKSKYSKYGEDLSHKSEYEYAPRYDSLSRTKYTVSRPSRPRGDVLKGYDYMVDRPLDDMRSETQYPADDGRFDSRNGMDEPLTTPSLPKYRDRPENPKDTTSEPYVDMYGWRGPSRPANEPLNEPDLRNKHDSPSYQNESQNYGSRSGTLLTASYEKDGAKARSL